MSSIGRGCSYFFPEPAGLEAKSLDGFQVKVIPLAPLAEVWTKDLKDDKIPAQVVEILKSSNQRQSRLTSWIFA